MKELAEDHDDGSVARIAAIDIAKTSGMVCLRVPHHTVEGRRVQQVWNVASTTNAILELGDKLICQGVQRVVMESTGPYWRPFFYLLEVRGLECWLVNARDVKNVPGRPKTDKLDAVWLAKLAERGMVRASFVPPKPVRQLRDLTRTRTVFVQERTRHKHRVDKILQDAQIKLSSVVSDLFGVSSRAMLDALVAGERSPRTLADLARGSLIEKKSALIESLTGQFDDHHGRLLGMLLETVDHLTAQVRELDRLIALALEQITAPLDNSGTNPPDAGATSPTTARTARDLVERLDAIPGVGPTAARIILAEIGADMSRFPTPEHLVSWAKLCPRTTQSGAKNTAGPTGRGNPWLKGALGEAASAAARTDTFLGARYRRIVKRRGHSKAVVAIARSILVIAWHLINDPDAAYQELGADWHQRHLNPARKTRDLVRQLQALGHTVSLAPAS
ncbi:IS110 family transposase [Streptomyces spinoverrucosus]|uniref:IS110 family transposase n=1 Tax=Streptomyces spinoverrucosus TaxID=284043 RepID=A0A4Y3VYN8_9ACTN|nr:IS110 family transposase [Streptomyces spinoverrucosus]GEC10770.1 IS110 family transposase [Streptomyces spinoverrucosus]GHB51433.1 IS110 family transposase [Streptomyces spinoverrucosus]